MIHADVSAAVRFSPDAASRGMAMTARKTAASDNPAATGRNARRRFLGGG
jgi:hypothetical protein